MKSGWREATGLSASFNNEAGLEIFLDTNPDPLSHNRCLRLAWP